MSFSINLANTFDEVSSKIKPCFEANGLHGLHGLHASP